MRLKPEDLILWSDEVLLAVNKPAGLPTLPDGYDPAAPHLKSVLEPVYGRLWIVHRLDRETSGVLLLARSAQAHRLLNMQFERRAVAKVYHALVEGNPDWDERKVDLPLRQDGDRKHRTVVDHRQGKPAVTNLRVLTRFGRYALVEARPETGRTHQIRAHLAAAGNPIAADALYGSGEGIYLSAVKAGYKPDPATERPLIERVALHAASLIIEHPQSGQPVLLEAPYPKDFRAAVNQLHRSR